MTGPKRPCSWPGCRELVSLDEFRCAKHERMAQEHRAQRGRKHDVKRRAGQPWRGWYKLARWARLRARQLQRQPLCEMCLERGVTKLAEVVDHIKEHKGDPRLFWSSDNHQSLCKRCHDSEKQALERERERSKSVT
ncbi:MAG: HNH endonuclease [Pseudomonadota bacterium]